jgi:hypothetical protein
MNESGCGFSPQFGEIFHGLPITENMAEKYSDTFIVLQTECYWILAG